MQIIQAIIQPILNAGSTVFVPLIMLILGLVVGLRFKDALNAGLLTGVAFCSVSLVMGYMGDIIGPVLAPFVENTGLDLTYVDAGWTVASSITMGNVVPYFSVFPITFGINILMLVLKWTDTMNVDVWNYWGKAYTASLVEYFSGSLALGLAVAAIQTVMELKTADCMAASFQDVTGIPGITSTHCMFMKGALLYPVDQLIAKIPGLDREFNIDTIKSKIGVLGETHVVGFIVGTIIALFARYNLADAATVGVKLGAALLLFPRVSKIFMEALEPISDQAGTFLREKFNGRELNVGLDWPFLAGRPETWLVGLLTVPLTIVCMTFIPGNHILPINTINFTGAALCVLVYSNGNVLRMLISSIIFLPLYYVTANFAAPALTALASKVGFHNAIVDEYGGKLALLGDDAPFWRYGWEKLFSEGGTVIGIVVLVVYMAGFIYFYRSMMKKSAELRAKK
ncbi:MAG: PTS galactitol transporter subunit IIC [Erysipelotrichaceae bacterium]|jgi:PTS system galactitol-specific IIC component|nr:PTS galactitol transporter subunit IIC [Erysipelotrichaceae bacterium]